MDEDENADERGDVIAKGSCDAILDAVWRLAADLGDGSLTPEVQSRLELIGKMLENALGLNEDGIRHFATYGLTNAEVHSLGLP